MTNFNGRLQYIKNATLRLHFSYQINGVLRLFYDVARSPTCSSVRFSPASWLACGTPLLTLSEMHSGRSATNTAHFLETTTTPPI